MVNNWNDLEPANFEKWMSRDLWTMHQFVFLIHGKEPVSMKDVAHNSPIDKSYNEIEELLLDAERIANLTPDYFGSNNNPFTTSKYCPVNILEWAKTKQIDIAPQILSLLDTITVLMDPRERHTFLTIIGILAKECQLPLENHYTASDILSKKAAKHNIVIPSKSDAIANKLKEANEYLKSL